MIRRLFLGVPLLAFWLFALLSVVTILASRVDAGAFVPQSWTALATQVTGLTTLTGAGSATNDDLIIYDTSAAAIKRIARSELATVVGMTFAGAESYLGAGNTMATGFADGIWVNLTGWTSRIDTNTFVTSDGTWTVPSGKAGYYRARFGMVVTITGVAGAAWLSGQIRVNSAQVSGTEIGICGITAGSTSSPDFTVPVESILNLAVGDTVKPYVMPSGANDVGSIQGNASTGRTTFSLQYLGPRHRPERAGPVTVGWSALAPAEVLTGRLVPWTVELDDTSNRKG